MDEWLAQIGLKGRALESAVKSCEDNFVDDVQTLQRLAKDKEQFKETFPQSVIRSVILEALASDEHTQEEVKQTERTRKQKEELGNRNTESKSQSTTHELPKGKRYGYFASHKKHHSRFGDSSADLARASKDYMQLKYNLEGYFDADNLQKINAAAISKGIVESCCLLVYLNDETLDSPWCRHEVNEARRYSIPIIVVVDTDKQTSREVIDKYMEKGYNWLFAEQVINYSTAFRTQSYEVACKAIRRAIEYCHANDTLTPKSKPTAIETTEQTGQSSKDDQANTTAEGTTDAKTRPHDANEDADAAVDAKQKKTKDAGGPLAALKKALLSVYGSAQAAFDALSNSDGIVERKQWKKAIKKTSLSEDFSGKNLKILRGTLPKVTSLSAFCSFMDEPAVESESLGLNISNWERKRLRKSITNSSSSKAITLQAFEEIVGVSVGQDAHSLHLAKLPVEVPAIPPSFRSRPFAQRQLTEALLNRSGKRSTALTAPKSRISSQGMGGVGKTMLTAAVVRSVNVRSAFAIVCWTSLSQQPEINTLQRRLLEQITGKTVQDKTESTEFQLEQLIEAAKGKSMLLVLDDLWDRLHQKPFDCVDTTTVSKLLVTTRIKGILERGHEIELALLGVQESVELLAAVAQIDADQTPPCCLEIAQLCGRLPLCLNIVGQLIRTFGEGWEDEIPTILRKDMKSLTTDKGDSSQPLNLQQRVIQSGLDSLDGENAEDIVILFKGMAVFAEDQIIPVAILSVLWVSIDPEEHKPLSAMKVRQWVSQLLSRSILLGSATDGVSMHDIVRDFCVGVHPRDELQVRQRQFVQAVIDTTVDGSCDNEGSKSKVVQSYGIAMLSQHMKAAISTPLSGDVHAQAWLLSNSSSYSSEIRHQVMHSVDMSEINELALWFSAKGDFWASGSLWVELAELSYDVLSKMKHYRDAVLVLSKIEGKHPKALQLLAYVRGKVFDYTDREEEGDLALEWLLALADDPTRFAELSAKVQASVRGRLGLALMGYASSKYCVNPPRDKLLGGLREFFILCSSYVHESLEWGYTKWYAKGSSLCPVGLQCITYIAPELTSEYAPKVIGKEGQLFIEWHDVYEFERDHARSSSVNLDYQFSFLSLNIRARFCAIRTTDRFIEDWFALNEKVKTAALVPFETGAVHVWGRLPSAVLQRVMLLWSVSWKTAGKRFDELPRNKMAWQREQDGRIVRFHDRAALLLNAQLVNLAKLPHVVQEGEAVDFLPEPSCALLADRTFDVQSQCESPMLQAAHVAQHITMNNAAARYARAALEIHTNPMDKHFAFTTLGAIHALGLAVDGCEHADNAKDSN